MLKHLDANAQLSIPKPCGIAFDEWRQNFFAERASANVLWMTLGTMRPRYGVYSPESSNLIESDHLVRPTSGLEFVSSRHFPHEVQGDFLLNNTIGFLGTKQHTQEDDGTDYSSPHRQELLR